MVLMNPNSTTWFTDAIYWDTESYSRSYGTTSFDKTTRITINENGFVFIPYSQKYKNKPAYYVAWK